MKIGSNEIKDFSKSYIIAEIGINHNGNVDIAKQLIKVAHEAGCDAVKFQKRTVNVVYSAAELAVPRESPFGSTNGDLKRGLEFGFEEYKEIFEFCKKLGIDCFASPWDTLSVDFLEQFNPVCYKVASATITDIELLEAIRETGRPVILSTGMSSLEEISNAVRILKQNQLILTVCTSTYPNLVEEINLNRLDSLRNHFDCSVGYSGHELGYWPTLAAAAKGAAVIERHITLSRTMWGSDQSASLEPEELKDMVEGIRCIESSLGSAEIGMIDREIPVLQKLRRVKSLSAL
ncbi:N-acetylneuraminate synthase [Bacillus pseudomycoides]|uniref:N-acetylneuraminate synthase family protein n=1 Tax=Bacillus TaxID=1386 RepID=UPI00036EA325|nr:MULTISPECIES: N-acetylneuraminate synthase family protein [Bacillus]PEK39636.1 N-acetylneuraminate synthase [Bacillus pseudomycoides]PEP38729.1 N-acetylneuraminate synthase [Bacillus pseudomycoides]PEP40650.1 N-acetylneuraminate synthase [Bacillus pseudomycoides]PFX44328.1 N-acetylneuraminate synthase [Bacillus pseudomycoides]PFZ82452.1 N-acetylneuraminate synthase [Bacillus pseudomycoides]